MWLRTSSTTKWFWAILITLITQYKTWKPQVIWLDCLCLVCNELCCEWQAHANHPRIQYWKTTLVPVNEMIWLWLEALHKNYRTWTHLYVCAQMCSTEQMHSSLHSRLAKQRQAWSVVLTNTIREFRGKNRGKWKGRPWKIKPWIPGLYSHAVQPCSAAVQCSHAVQPCSAAIQCSHAVQPCSAAMQCSRAVQPCSAMTTRQLVKHQPSQSFICTVSKFSLV